MKNFAKATLVYPFQDEKVYLGIKQKKVAAGLRSGYGGKKEKIDNSILDTAIRELDQENNYQIHYEKQNLEPRAIIDFRLRYSDSESFYMRVFIYILNGFDGVLGDSSEIKNAQGFSLEEIPYENMLADNKLFLPRIFSGEYLVGEIESFDNKIVKNSLKKISKNKIQKIFDIS